MMMKNKEEILADMDATLDQLILNAESMRKVASSKIETSEACLLQKTQESLLARLMHADALLKEKQTERRKLAKKVARFSRLNATLLKQLHARFSCARRRKSIRG